MHVAKRVDGYDLVLVKVAKGRPAVRIKGRAGMESLEYILPQIPVKKRFLTKFEPSCKENYHSPALASQVFSC